MTSEDAQSSALSVSQALSIAKNALEGITVKILGEVSEVSNKPGYKAVYFSIKDDGSTLPCMMWMNRYNASGVEIKVGSLVEISGRFSLYAAKGRMNFDVFSISLAGEGNLRLKVANLAKKLQAQGLMDQERKRRIPRYPERIGLVTSPRGAAVHDVLRTLRRRYPLAKVFLAGVPVEGAGAAAAIGKGIELCASYELDVILLVRGGGSFEDLMPFNDEALAYTIAASKVPIVTGIGHEPDTSIADMVADLRASTPTAAAESIAPAFSETVGVLDNIAHRLHALETARVLDAKKRVELITAREMFSDPLRLFTDEAQTIDDLASRLSRAIPEQLGRSKERLGYLGETLARISSYSFAFEGEQVRAAASRIDRIGQTILDRFTTQIMMAATGLENLSPLGVLQRGYAITKKAEGVLLSSIKDVEKNDKIEVLVADGFMECSVDAIHESTITIERFDVDDRRKVT